MTEFLDDILKRDVLGKVRGFVYSVEFQKRSVPHLHLLLMMEANSTPQSTLDLDNVIWSEIPDPLRFPRLHTLVVKHMDHSSCRNNSTNPVCLNENTGKCRYYFPQEWQTETQFGVGNKRTVHRRRSPDDGGLSVKKGRRSVMDNRWVASYNPGFLLKFNCHINVQHCNSLQAIEYLCKYVNKGNDKIGFQLLKDSEEKILNEVKDFMESRYLTPTYCMWRLFDFDLHKKSPTTVELAVHLPQEQLISIKPHQQSPDELRRLLENRTKTSLEHGFDLNEKYEKTSTVEVFRNGTRIPNPNELLYHQIPEYYLYDKKKGFWKARENCRDSMGFLRPVRKIKCEEWYLSLILRHVKGAKSFDDLLTFENVKYKTFEEVCVARGLLEDGEYIKRLFIECALALPTDQFVELFVTVLLTNSHMDAADLWNEYKGILSGRSWSEKPEKAELACLRKISKLIAVSNYILEDFNLPSIPDFSDLSSYEIEHTYNDEEKANFKVEFDTMYETLNDGQKKIVDTIMYSDKKYVSVNAAGGCGKTYAAKCIMNGFRMEGRIVLAVASTGVAAMILPNGKTVHSQFKMPIDLTEESLCGLKENSNEGLIRLLKKTDLIIWDECPNSKRLMFKCLDKTLRIILGVDEPFGGILMLLTGDFRQCVAVVENTSNPAEIVDQSIIRDPVWLRYFEKMELSENMRVRNEETDGIKTDWSEYLLEVGEDKLEKRYINGKDNSIIDPRLCDEYECIEDFVEKIYPDYANRYKDHNWLNERGILTPLNRNVDAINEILYDALPETETILFSSHTVLDPHVDPSLWPMETIENLVIPGMPKHELRLKKHTVVMCMRNINPACGLRNGTKLVVEDISSLWLRCRIISDIPQRGDVVNICRIRFTYDASKPRSKSPVSFIRLQFPLQVCYAMTINKAQGQTLPYLGIYLPDPVFAHGQLYTGFSRSGKRENIYVYIQTNDKHGYYDGEWSTSNVVYPEFLEFI